MPDAYVHALPNGYGAAISLMVEMLVSAGWTYRASGDAVGNYAPPSVTSTVTISNATPAVVTWTTHGLPANAPVVFTTTGALPTGITAGTTYYVMSTGLVANAFQISATPGGVAINTSSAGSGVHTGTSLPKIFTGTGSGALGWNNSQAWVRVQDPAGIREFTFQHDAAGRIIVKYSTAAKFTGAFNGTVTSSQPPTALDEVFLAGSIGSYYGGTGNPLVWLSTSTTKAQALCMGYASSTAPYGFWFANQDHPRGFLRGGIMFDPVRSVPEDPDPYVLHIGGQNVFGSGPNGFPKDPTVASTWSQAAGTTIDGCWAFMDTARTQFLYVQPAAYGFGPSASSGQTMVMDYGLPSNPFNGKPEALPVAYMRVNPNAFSQTRTQRPGLKGWSTMARFTGSPKTTFADTIEGKSFVAVGCLWLPWNGLTTPGA